MSLYGLRVGFGNRGGGLGTPSSPAPGEGFIFGFRGDASLFPSVKESPLREAELRAGQAAETPPSKEVTRPGARAADLRIPLGTLVQAVRGVEGLYLQRPPKPRGPSRDSGRTSPSAGRRFCCRRKEPRHDRLESRFRGEIFLFRVFGLPTVGLGAETPDGLFPAPPASPPSSLEPSSHPSKCQVLVS